MMSAASPFSSFHYHPHYHHPSGEQEGPAATRSGGGDVSWMQQQADSDGGGRPLGRVSTILFQRFSTDFLLSTPSVTSASSSDLDTESTVSFFPERSTTLGSLIGFHTIPQRSSGAIGIHGTSQQAAEDNDAAYASAATAEMKHMSNSTESGNRASAMLARTRSWCPCSNRRGFSHPQSMGMSPSLAHLLEMERRKTSTTAATSEEKTKIFEKEETTEHGNTTYTGQYGTGVVLPARRPSGAPLRLFLQQSSSPVSSYLSAEWGSLGSRSSEREEEEEEEEEGNPIGRFQAFWLCGKAAGGRGGG